MKNVLILASSPRRGGNTDVLCDEFAKGAKYHTQACKLDLKVK